MLMNRDQQDEEARDEEYEAGEASSRRGSVSIGRRGSVHGRRGSLKGSADLDAAMNQLRDEEPLIQVRPFSLVDGDT
jgi:hypothetical protein